MNAARRTMIAAAIVYAAICAIITLFPDMRLP